MPVTPMFPEWMNVRGNHVFLDVVVSPRASKTRIMGVHDGCLKVQLAAPPVDGKANEALVRFLADALGVARAHVDIVGGAANKRKTVRLCDVPAHLVFVKLSPPSG